MICLRINRTRLYLFLFDFFFRVAHYRQEILVGLVEDVDAVDGDPRHAVVTKLVRGYDSVILKTKNKNNFFKYKN